MNSSARGTGGFDPIRLRRLAEIEDRHFWFAGRRALLSRMLRNMATAPPGLILDLGCGTGFTLVRLAEAGYHVVGIDLLADGLLNARRMHPGFALAQGNGTALPLRSGSCCGILLLDVLEHGDDARLLREARRVLVPGGWLLLSVPAMPWLWSQRDVGARHVRRYTRTGLLALLRGAGLQVEDVRFYQCLLFPLLAASRLLGKRHARWRDAEERLPMWLNEVFAWINHTEAKWGDYVPWPWGSTLAALCRRPA